MPINYKDYHPKWSLISRLIRFTRAKNKCEWCGAQNGHPHPITGSKVVLTVAHVDQNRNNNRFENLAALCQRCHLGHDLRQHVFNRKYGRMTKYVNGKLFCNTLLQTVTTLFVNKLGGAITPTPCCNSRVKTPVLVQTGQKWGFGRGINNKINLLFYCYTVTKQ